jgi:dTDP-4-dehydrorhamnose reductase
MQYLITGAGGMLGTSVQSELRRCGRDFVATEVAASDAIVALDIRDWDVVRGAIRTFRPDLVLHLAAETDVDRCELEPDHAFATNAFGTENVVRACLEQDCAMAYISTGNVFDGQKSEPYVEYDMPGPVNTYGRSKLEGERVVRESMERYFIIRAGWMVGGWEVDKKFVYKIAQLCRTSDQLKVVDDKFGSPTFTVDFAGNLMPLIESGRYGLYHMTNQGTGSRLDIAREIVRHLGVEDRVEVVPVKSDAFPMPAERPRSEMMRNLKLDLLGLNGMPTWQASLEHYIKQNRSKWEAGEV